MSTSNLAAATGRSVLRKWVLGALVVGAVAAAGAGTFASFSASTQNADNVFSTGAMELSNTNPSATTCLSGHTGPGATPQADLDDNDNATCDELIDLTLASPGDTDEGRVALVNTGDYNGTLQFFVPTPGCADADTILADPAGTGDLCSKLEVYIQETQSNYTTTKTGCVFPFKAVATCATDFSDSTNTIDDLAASATPASADPATPLTLSMGAGNTRYFVVKVNFADAGLDPVTGLGLDNAYQNRSAAFGLTWRLQEA